MLLSWFPVTKLTFKDSVPIAIFLSPLVKDFKASIPIPRLFCALEIVPVVLWPIKSDPVKLVP